MRTARALVRVPGRVGEAEALWYDLSRWPAWVEGFAAFVRREGDWPRAGASVTWDSKPAGRGRVREEVISYEPRAGQVVEVEDPKLRGRQTVAFAASGEEAVVELRLDYELKQEGPLVPVTDLLFIRRALRDSLRRTLVRFARELRAEREL